MFDHDDLKWLAANTTELNRLLQEISRSSEEARQHPDGSDFLEPLQEQVEQASRLSQSVFDRVTARILSGAGGRSPTDRTDLAVAAAAPFCAEVSVRMPVGEIAAAKSEPVASVIRNPQGERELILLVDDDRELLERTGEILDFEDYKVIVAKDGPEALEIYRRMGRQIALVILDFFLPVMDGGVVFDELKAIDSNVRVVLSSGFGEQARLGSMLAHGLSGFIPKPYTHEKLIEQVRLVLDA